MSGPAWDSEEEAAFALAAAPLMRELLDLIRARVPEGTHFTVALLPPNADRRGWGRLLVGSTDRAVMLPNLANWVLTMLEQQQREGG
jgi:hypothetical protein